MGNKTHPYGFRLGYTKDWRSRWYADKDYADLLHEDIAVRDSIKEKLFHAGISKIDIERAATSSRSISTPLGRNCHRSQGRRGRSPEALDRERDRT